MRSLTKVIGFCGNKRAGKNSAAEFLMQNLTESGKRVEMHAFADPLREMLYSLDPVVISDNVSGFSVKRLSSLVDMYGWERAKSTTYGPGLRELLQRLGTNAVRAQAPTFWTDLMGDRIRAAERNGLDYFLIPDVRFENEAALCDELVHLRRPGTVDGDAHLSEADPLEVFPERISWILENNGTLVDLQDAVDNFVAPRVRGERPSPEGERPSPEGFRFLEWAEEA